MTFDWSEWGPPLMVLAAGVGAGVVIAALLRGSDEEAKKIEAEGRRLDLEHGKEAVLRALHDLELERDKMSPEDYVRERQVLLAQGADAMRGLERPDVAPPTTAPVADDGLSAEVIAALDAERRRLGDAKWRDAVLRLAGGAPRPTGLAPEWKGALYAFGVVLVGVLLYVAAGGASVDRREGASMTGNQELGSGPQADPTATARADARQKWLDALEADPQNLEALNKLTTLALADQDAATAMQFNERALAVAADDPDALTQRGVLQAMMGMPDKALDTLARVLSQHPDHPMANVYQGLIAMDAGRPELAVPAFEKALALGAANEPFLRAELAKARAAAGGSGGDAPAGTGADLLVSGTITIDNAVAGAAPLAKSLFVSVRDPAGGPPLVAKKLPPGPFPMTFTLTTADRIPMGGDRPLPEAMDVYFQLDLDGNPMSKADNEPLATAKGLARGATEVAVELK